jgi:hypothetical protein
MNRVKKEIALSIATMHTPYVSRNTMQVRIECLGLYEYASQSESELVCLGNDPFHVMSEQSG